MGVENLEKATEFYEKRLELPRREWNGDIAFFELEGAWLSLYSKESLAEDAGVVSDGKGFSGVTIAHNVATKSEVDEVLKLAEEAGAEITKPAEEKSWGGYSGYFKDLDGHLWEVAYNPHADLS